jgi:putative MATE family efflux protein
LQMLVIALGALIGNGLSIIVSQYWGAKKDNQVQDVLNNAFTLILLIAIVLAVLVFSSGTEILSGMGLDSLLLADAKSYFVPITLGAIFVLSLSSICDLLRAQTNMQGLLLIIVLGAIANVLLDYLFIVVANLGISGAAYATLLGQLMGVIIGVRLLKGHKHGLDLTKLRINFNIGVIRKFVSLGLPVFISYLGASIVMLVVNMSIATSGLINKQDLLAAYGIVSRINIFIILPLIAISSASQTIIAYNFGAKNTTRLNQATMIGVAIATCYLSIMALCIYLLPKQIIGVFSQQESLFQQTQTIASVMFLMLPFSGTNAICVAYFQAIGKAKYALTLSIAQVYIFLVPGILLIHKIFDLSKIWYAYPLTHSLSFLLAVSLLWISKTQFNFVSIKA